MVPQPAVQSNPSAIWILAKLQGRLPDAAARVERLEDLAAVLQGMVDELPVLPLERALQSVEACVTGVTLDESASAAPRGWKFWRRAPDSLATSTLVMADDLQQNFAVLRRAGQDYVAAMQVGRVAQSKGYVEFCMEAKSLQRFLQQALKELEAVYNDLRSKFESATSSSAVTALKTIHGKARALTAQVRAYDEIGEIAVSLQEAVTAVAAAREAVLTAVGPQLATHVDRLKSQLDDIDVEHKVITRAEKVMRARAARAQLQGWLDHASEGVMRLQITQHDLGRTIGRMTRAVATLHALEAGEAGEAGEPGERAHYDLPADPRPRDTTGPLPSRP